MLASQTVPHVREAYLELSESDATQGIGKGDLSAFLLRLSERPGFADILAGRRNVVLQRGRGYSGQGVYCLDS